MSLEMTRGLVKESDVEGTPIPHGVFVKLGTTDDVVAIATLPDDTVIGVSYVEGDPRTVTTLAGDRISIFMSSIAELRLGGTVSRNDILIPNAVGRGIRSNIAGQRGAAIALRSGVANDFIPVLFVPATAALTNPAVDFTAIATIATAGPVTYTAAQLLGGLILRATTGAARSDTTPTAALIVAAISGALAGRSFEFTIRNDAGAAETITLLAGVGVTLSGTMTIAQNNMRRFRLVITNAGTATEAVTIYSLGTVVF